MTATYIVLQVLVGAFCTFEQSQTSCFQSLCQANSLQAACTDMRVESIFPSHSWHDMNKCECIILTPLVLYKYGWLVSLYVSFALY